MDFKDIVMARYATKMFNKEMVPEEKMAELIELIRFAPSSFNLQPWKIKVVSDQETKEKLLEHSWNQPQVTSCSHLLVFCTNTAVTELIDKLEKQMLDSGADAEKIAGYVGMMRQSMQRPPEALLQWAQKQVYIALGNAMNGAKALGLDSCPMEGFVPEKYDEILGLSGDVRSCVVLPVGYAADTPRPKLRFDTKDILVE